MPLDREWIERHIPHKGRMCLLDEVLAWDAAHIRCRSGTHRSAANPLRAHGRLGVACGIEYAAQAMAVHGALIAASAPLASTVATSVRGSIGAGVGYLASVRNVTLAVSDLDQLGEDLIADAERITGDGRTVLYDFTVSCGRRPLLAGRASIVFGTAVPAAPVGTGSDA